MAIVTIGIIFVLETVDSVVSGSRDSPTTAAILGVLAAAELLVRGLSSILSVVEPLAALTTLLLRYGLNLAVLGRAIGWLLFGIVVFQVLPEMYADEYLDWGNDVLNRVVVATGAVILGFYANVLVGRLDVFAAAPFAPPPQVVGATLAAVVVLVVVLMAVPTFTPDLWVIHYRRPLNDDLSTGDRSKTVLLSRTVLLLVLAGLVLAVVGRLFPLAEIAVILLGGYEWSRSSTESRGDIAERLLGGLRGVWYGPRGVLGMLYGVYPILLVVMLGRAYGSAVAGASPTAVVLVGLPLLFGAIHIVAGSVRTVERLPAALRDTGGSDVGAGPRIPGLLLPGTAAFVFVELSRTTTHGWLLPASLGVSGIAITAAAALVLIFLSLGTILLPGRIPTGVDRLVTVFAGRFRLPDDYLAVALGPSLFATAFGTVVLKYTIGHGVTGAQLPIPSIALSILLYVVGPFVGYELFNAGRTDSDGNVDRVGLWDVLGEAWRAGPWLIGSFGLMLVASIAGNAVAAPLVSLALIPFWGVVVRVPLAFLSVLESL